MAHEPNYDESFARVSFMHNSIVENDKDLLKKKVAHREQRKFEKIYNSNK